MIGVAEASRRLSAGEISSVELTSELLAHIGAHNDHLNAVITVTGEQALAQAESADARRAAGVVVV